MKKAVLFAVLMVSLTATAFAADKSAGEGFAESTGHFFHNVWPGNWPCFGGTWE